MMNGIFLIHPLHHRNYKSQSLLRAIFFQFHYEIHCLSPELSTTQVSLVLNETSRNYDLVDLDPE